MWNLSSPAIKVTADASITKDSLQHKSTTNLFNQNFIWPGSLQKWKPKGPGRTIFMLRSDKERAAV